MTERALTTPVFTGELNGKPLRFFKAPRPGPHLVWHSWDDMLACFALPRDLRRHFKARLQQDYRTEIETVATSEGITTVAPHWMAQGLIGSMTDLGFASNGTDISYARESVKAWNVAVGDLPPGANFDLMVAAFQNTNKMGGNA